MSNRIARILVVDDEPNTCKFLARVLSAKAWGVDTACDGATALNLVRRNRYDVAILDYRMPGMDGAELCRRIREIQPDVREVFLTGYATIDKVFPAIQAGAERVLAKPVDPGELIAVLESQIG
jgi:DNA-binding response OmpR family regulator